MKKVVVTIEIDDTDRKVLAEFFLSQDELTDYKRTLEEMLPSIAWAAREHARLEWVVNQI